MKWSKRRERIEQIAGSLVVMTVACAFVYGSIIKSYVKYTFKGR